MTLVNRKKDLTFYFFSVILCMWLVDIIILSFYCTRLNALVQTSSASMQYVSLES